MQHKSTPLTPETPDGQTLNRFAKFSVVQTGERSERGTPRYKVYGHYANGQMVWIDSLYLHDQAITDAWQRAEDADTLRQQNGDVGIVADPCAAKEVDRLGAEIAAIQRLILSTGNKLLDACDARAVVSLGNGRHRVTHREPSVRVNDMVLKCVGFLGRVTHKDSTSFDGELIGTGCFVSVPTFDKGYKFSYFVTAKHVLEGLAGEEPYLLVNRKNGGVQALWPEDGKWWTHPTDDAVDVAVMPFRHVPELDIVTILMEQLCLTPENIQRYSIGVGDEVFITGLFTPAPGKARNIPIVRHGNIAMLPDEQIQTELGYADVYLVEARSIGGLSGSPAFVRETVHFPVVEEKTGDVIRVLGYGRTQFMGLVHGHWDIPASAKNQHIFDSHHGVNMGIGIVVPAIKIMETLHHPDLVSMRENAEKDMRQKMIPKADIAKHGETPHQQFSALASRVFSTPRDEILKREDEFKKQQKSKKRAGKKR